MQITEVGRGLSRIVAIRRQTPSEGIMDFVNIKKLHGEALEQVYDNPTLHPFDPNLRASHKFGVSQLEKTEAAIKRGPVMKTSIVIAGLGELVLRRVPVSKGTSEDRIPEGLPDLEATSTRSFHHKD